MSQRKPLIAYSILIGDDDPEYDVYTDAYGLEMNYDDEWNLDTVIVVPPEYLPILSSQTDIDSMGISAGTNYLPKTDAEAPSGDVEWLVVNLGDVEIDFEHIRNRKLIVISSELSKMKRFLGALDDLKSPSIAFAIPFSSVEKLGEQVTQVRRFLDKAQLMNVRIIAFIESSNVNLNGVIRTDFVDGFYHRSSGYEELLDVMSDVGSSQ